MGAKILFPFNKGTWRRVRNRPLALFVVKSLVNNQVYLKGCVGELNSTLWSNFVLCSLRKRPFQQSIKELSTTEKIYECPKEREKLTCGTKIVSDQLKLVKFFGKLFARGFSGPVASLWLKIDVCKCWLLVVIEVQSRRYTYESPCNQNLYGVDTEEGWIGSLKLPKESCGVSSKYVQRVHRSKVPRLLNHVMPWRHNIVKQC